MQTSMRRREYCEKRRHFNGCEWHKSWNQPVNWGRYNINEQPSVRQNGERKRETGAENAKWTEEKKTVPIDVRMTPDCLQTNWMCGMSERESQERIRDRWNGWFCTTNVDNDDFWLDWMLLREMISLVLLYVSSAIHFSGYFICSLVVRSIR